MSVDWIIVSLTLIDVGAKADGRHQSIERNGRFASSLPGIVSAIWNHTA